MCLSTGCFFFQLMFLWMFQLMGVVFFSSNGDCHFKSLVVPEVMLTWARAFSAKSHLFLQLWQG